VAKAVESEAAAVAATPPGSENRNNRLNVAAFKCGQLVGAGALDRADVEARLALAARHCGLGENETEKTIRSGLDAGIAQPRDLADVGTRARANGRGHPNGHAATAAAAPPRHNRTDLGNARRLVATYGHTIRYCYPWGEWLIWDGKRWRADRTGRIYRFAKKVARLILVEASRAHTKAERKALSRWSHASESKKRIDAMIALAQSEPGIPITPEDVDRDHWLLNVANGTIDLRSGAIKRHDPKDLITKLTAVRYDPDATCPLWESTLLLVFDAKLALVDFWQRLCGYVLTGDVSEQVLPIPHGSGANGKSTILNTLLALLGEDYSMKAAPDMFLTRRSEAHPTERADLQGKRLVVAIETGEGRRLNEVFIKEATGGDKIRARRMREDFWEFWPTHKIMLCTNHRPVVKGTDHAIWRRIRLIPFVVRIDDDRADRRMIEKLAAELPGILAWCVRGCIAWQRSGLDAPEDVTKATDGYRAEMDILGSFLTEMCVQGRDYRCRASDLYAEFQAWSERENEAIPPQRTFGMALTERGFERKTNDGTWYHGIGLRSIKI
jgi:putative DNA primase/helicase